MSKKALICITFDKYQRMSRSHPLHGNIPKLLEDADSEINARACSIMGLDRGSRCSQDRSLISYMAFDTRNHFANSSTLLSFKANCNSCFLSDCKIETKLLGCSVVCASPAS